jgi:hypothetical protein
MYLTETQSNVVKVDRIEGPGEIECSTLTFVDFSKSVSIMHRTNGQKISK